MHQASPFIHSGSGKTPWEPTFSPIRMGAQGSARAGTHDVDAEFKVKDFPSLQKRDRRRKRGPGRHPKRGPALNPSSDHSSNPTRGRAATPGAHSTSTLSPTPVWEVASFVPDRIEIPDVPGDHIMVLGKIPVPQHLLVDFLKRSHHPLAYSCRDRVVSTPVGAPRDDRPFVPMEADASTTSLVDAEPSPMTEPTPTAGPAVPSSIAEPTPAAGPTAPSPTVETTPEFGPTVLPSIAEPTPVAESAAEAPSSLAEPTPSPTEPVVPPEDVATTPVEGPACVPEVCYLGLSLHDWAKVRRTSGAWEHGRVEELGTTAGGVPFIKFRVSKEITKKIPAPSWDSRIRLAESDFPSARGAARPSVTPSRPGVIQSTDDPAGLTSTMEADDVDDDWVLVEPNKDIPALPTTSWGGVDFTRLDLGHAELVSYEDWTSRVSFDFVAETYDDDDAAQTAIEDARYSLLATYLERQMNADRVATLSNCDVFMLTIKSTRGADGMRAATGLNKEEKAVARARGFTRCCERELDSDGMHLSGRCIFRDKGCLATTLTWATITSCASLCPPSFVRLRNCGCNSLGSGGVSGWEGQSHQQEHPIDDHAKRRRPPRSSVYAMEVNPSEAAVFRPAGFCSNGFELVLAREIASYRNRSEEKLYYNK
ncbi:hypothetical protein THAOC_08692 [Thalassiosira oceanica]|uniref:Uncharacterized protein n=1 Tax=Thalassiosira oceanica TaxID=159749 RepID=K0SX27_THAOC|nr:hypothetical protein THAOC_08692 [Thalassiosira oceanica]|eukprot:EJK69990.1 hypothetical protein THAOC_08692 [Thalassiosira oceanica]